MGDRLPRHQSRPHTHIGPGRGYHDETAHGTCLSRLTRARSRPTSRSPITGAAFHALRARVLGLPHDHESPGAHALRVGVLRFSRARARDGALTRNQSHGRATGSSLRGCPQAFPLDRTVLQQKPLHERDTGTLPRGRSQALPIGGTASGAEGPASCMEHRRIDGVACAVIHDMSPSGEYDISPSGSS